MIRINTKQRLATALVGAACASALAAPAAFASHGFQPSDPADVPPPPSSIAASAGEAYSELRSPDAASSERGGSVDLRSPDSRNQPADYTATYVAPDAAEQPSEATGFDLVSAAIGAIAAAGLSIVLMAALAMRRPASQRAANA